MSMLSAQSGPRVDWGDALAPSTFYGRTEELAQLTHWLVQERCRVVSLLGMGGIGKSALAVSLMYQLSGHFEVVIFRSLRDAPSCEVLLDDCLQVLAPQSPRQASLERRIRLLLEHLHKTHVLLVLDNLEALLKEGDVRGHFRSGFEPYALLLNRLAEASHRSCLLLTSRERPAELRHLDNRYPQVRSLRLAGLGTGACQQLFMEKEVVGTSAEQEQLIEVYAGNPLALKIVGETIANLFSSKIGEFLSKSNIIFGNITDLLREHFARLSPLEQSILCWLAIARELMTLDELLVVLVKPLPRMQVLDALDSLRRRSLIEPGKRPTSFTLQSVVLEYVTAHLVAEACREIQHYRLDKLIQYGFSQARAKEYVRQTQERLLVSPFLAALQRAFHTRADVEVQLLSLLDELRKRPAPAQGYGPANLITLLRVQRGHLSGLDLSHLSIREMYLQGIEMRDTSLVETRISGTVLTEAITAPWSVAISPDGKWWAAGSMQGKVRVWEEESQTLHLIWQAHCNIVMALVFSPDGRTLASGSPDGTVKLWDLTGTRRDSNLPLSTSPAQSGGADSHRRGSGLSLSASSEGPRRDSGLPLSGPRGNLLWTGWQTFPQCLAFSPDGSLLASGGGDATICLWDPCNGTNLETLRHPSPVWAVAFSPDGRLLASGCFGGEVCLWERHQSEPFTRLQTLSPQTNWITDLAFAPEGRTLATAHRDPMIVRLWEVESLRLLHTFSELQAKHLAWSPDKRTLACSGSDKAIWLWDVEQGRCRTALHGHTADIYSLAFAPNGSRLLSGSADGTLRVWDMESYQCVRVIQGYGVALDDLDWSPDGTHLVSGGDDTLVTIWNVGEETASRVLRGHSWFVTDVRWSPDGRLVASCGWDRTIRLWNAASGTCVHIFEGQALLVCVAWSPDGNLLACGTHQRGMQMWDVNVRSLRWVGQPYQIGFSDVAWSPDGTQLASSSDDGSVYLWKSEDGTLLQRLSGHHGWVLRVAWSPDGTRLVSSSSSGELFVWDSDRRDSGLPLSASPEEPRRDSGLPLSASPVQTFVGHPSEVFAVAWSPDGDQLISGCGDGMLRWWDVQSGKCVDMQETHHGTVRSLKVSPDGKFLASCGYDEGAIRIWGLSSHELLRTLRHDRPYERLNITGIRGLTEAQKASLQDLGAIDNDHHF